MLEHECIAILRTEDAERPIIACRCGALASGVPGATWKVMEHPDKTVSLMPSVDWPGHFHKYVVGVICAKYSDLLLPDVADALPEAQGIP